MLLRWKTISLLACLFQIQNPLKNSLKAFKFKIIIKVFCDRLTLLMSNIIYPHQRGLIKDMNIGDTICIASKATNFLYHRTFDGNFSLKIDIRKTFDTLY